MSCTQFRVLYREFLFRIVDLELLPEQTDASRLLGQFAALLIFLSTVFSVRLGALDHRMPPEAFQAAVWAAEHALIAVTQVVVGLFAVLSWESIFPSRRDVLVIGPLPVTVRTLFLSRVAASATALALTVVCVNALTGLAYPLAMASAGQSVLDLILGSVRFFTAYWLTMLTIGVFFFGSVASLQGLAALLMPRQWFLRASAALQMAAFCLFLTTYSLAPSFTTPATLSADANQIWLRSLPSYWFLGFLQQLKGTLHPAMLPLAGRAWIALGTMAIGTASIYVLSYFRTLRKIVEEPDIVPGSRTGGRLPSFGDPLRTAVTHFSLRTVMRSRQHRMTLAFYLGIGFAIVALFVNTPGARRSLHAQEVALLFSSLMIMCVCIIGLRVVFAVPLALQANWIFRTTQVSPIARYMAAIRTPLFALAVAPVWLASAVFFLASWPWQMAVGHLVLLGLWGVGLAWLCLHGFGKIPFTCSWLPGKLSIHMAFLAALGMLLLMARAAVYERLALADPLLYAGITAGLAITCLILRWRTVAVATSDEQIVQFEELPAPALQGLGLHHDGILPIARGSGP